MVHISKGGSMHGKVLRSLASLGLVLSLGAGATYALFTSNSTTLQSSALTTGEAAIKLCNDSSDGSHTWKNTIAPLLSLNSLAPGADDSELTANHDLYVGNDDGSLSAGTCTTYEDAASSSDVSMKLVPVLANLTCGDDSLKNDLKLKFDIGGTASSTKSLDDWTTNTTSYGIVLAPGDEQEVKIFADFASASTVQNKTCTFDVTFTGKQV